MQELDGAHVDATSRLTRQQQAQISGKLSSEHDFLLVSSRERLDRLRVGAGADVELFDPVDGVRCDRAEPETAVLGVRVEVVEDQVLGDRELAHEPVSATVLGHKAEAGLDRLGG